MMKQFRWMRLLAGMLAAMMGFFGCARTDAELTESAPSATTAAVVETPSTEPEAEWVSAIFGGGPFVSSKEALKDVKESGFNTIMLWSVHVHSDGTLTLNDREVCRDGEYVGEEAWAEGWKYLKEEPTAITRIELSVGAAGCADFEGIKALIERDGTGEDTILYRNFKALIEVTGADAINYDDESCYDVDSAVAFGKMCAEMGMKITLCPFTYMDFWLEVYHQLGEELVDRIYLQCYDGGAGNNVNEWYRAFRMKIIPGYWCIHGGSGDSAKMLGTKLRIDKKRITGGFVWLYDDMMKLSSPNSTADYADAINSINQ